jgi:hypothetical protein
VDGGRRGEPHGVADLPDRRRIAAFADLLFDELENASLTRTDRGGHANSVVIRRRPVKHLYPEQLFDEIRTRGLTISPTCASLTNSRSNEHVFRCRRPDRTPHRTPIMIASTNRHGASMTATMSSNPNVDRITPRPVGRRSSRVSADVDYGIRRAVAAVIAVLLVAVVAIAVSTWQVRWPTSGPGCRCLRRRSGARLADRAHPCGPAGRLVVVDRRPLPRRGRPGPFRRCAHRPQRRHGHPGRPGDPPALSPRAIVGLSCRGSAVAAHYRAGVFCPACRADDTKVVDSRVAEEGTAIRRRRENVSPALNGSPRSNGSTTPRCRSSSPTAAANRSIARS